MNLDFFDVIPLIESKSGAIEYKRGCLENFPNNVVNKATPYPVARSSYNKNGPNSRNNVPSIHTEWTGYAISTWIHVPGKSKPKWAATNNPAQLGCALLRSPTEFFISATADENSEKCNSGQYGIGKTKSPDFKPASIALSSQSSLLVSTAAWYLPVAIP